MRRQVFPQAPSPTMTSFFLRAVMLNTESVEWNESLARLCPWTERNSMERKQRELKVFENTQITKHQLQLMILFFDCYRL